jgi:hypothetical protein
MILKISSMSRVMQIRLQSSEVLVLTDDSGAEVDRTASLSDEEDNEIAWTRDPDGRDTNSMDGWKFLASSRGF